jgi:hypothetical protein
MYSLTMTANVDVSLPDREAVDEVQNDSAGAAGDF